MNNKFSLFISINRLKGVIPSSWEDVRTWSGEGGRRKAGACGIRKWSERGLETNINKVVRKLYDFLQFQSTKFHENSFKNNVSFQYYQYNWLNDVFFQIWCLAKNIHNIKWSQSIFSVTWTKALKQVIVMIEKFAFVRRGGGEGRKIRTLADKGETIKYTLK